jgi:hypothetical protein
MADLALLQTGTERDQVQAAWLDDGPDGLLVSALPLFAGQDHHIKRSTVMKVFFLVVGWCLLFGLCWPWCCFRLFG